MILILTLIMGFLYALRSGNINFSRDEYKEMPLPNVVDYNFHIKPILSDNCYACHGPDANERQAGFRVDVGEAARSELPESPGRFGIVPGQPEKSAIYQHIISDDPNEVMPPPESNLALTSREKELLKKWISQGAAFDKHWAYIPPKKELPPKPKKKDWGNNEIDLFVLNKMEENGLAPSERAAPATLLRRMSLDLNGLPPTPALVDQLLTGNDPKALDKAIDILLASPAYGERMTQYWLDVARYADSHGYQDDSYRTMWPWRDWVIHAFNQNMPYDEFITLQLAGDLLPNATKEQILATGFNRNHPITQEGGVIQEEYRTNYVLDRTNTLGKGILGLTLECARCHDHKYDAISQANYFEFYAFFNQVDEKGLQMDAVRAAEKEFYADPPYLSITEEDKNGVLSFINMKNTTSVKVMVMNDSAPKTTYLLNRGEYDQPTDSVLPNAPDEVFPYSDALPKNRLGLAQWITHKDNPLTARVFVNQIWAMIFGKGLVETTEDFGVQGSLPTHPDLLDWLAVDFMENDWDIKYLIKKIVSSATYRQTSVIRPELKELDPENKWLATMPRFRMSGEMIRDYILASSGILNPEIGGPSVKPYQPQGLWEETNAGGNRGILTKYVQDKGEALYRRSLYTFWKRTLPPPNMTIFDAPTRDFCEVRRQKTNTPLQALALQNDVQVLEAARVLAQNLAKDPMTEKDKLTHLFRSILVRSPKTEELSLLQKYYSDTWESYNMNQEDALALVSHGEYPRNDADPIETAALMLTAQVVYNLDETITKE
ncbi:PSD1 and planctomycete cytochrome C domain-containing protein [Maribacter sp. 2307ULW6-5]|uniref:PSD1 and planctomycete cytochrome C domain-containing protein n=1 Tax=Maribacter sp. 2307ULW6-5 TaxID=3386275 RepID=UPI0039BC5518